MKPNFQTADGKITLYRVDCMEFMATLPDKAFSLAIVDPPYGLNIAKEKPRVSGRWNYIPKHWDSEIPKQDYFDELRRISKNSIIWGGNYFHLPPARGWVIWDKQQSVPNFAAAELAWTDFDEVVGMFRFSFAANLDKIHPTQKPVALYSWLLNKYAKPGQTIFDSHLGSASSVIACHRAGFTITGCELDADYFYAALDRIRRELQQQFLIQPQVAANVIQMTTENKPTTKETNDNTTS